jgi:hypothetical protein
MARRWVRFQMPVMVCVEVDELSQDARVRNVVVGSEQRDISLARDSTHVVLVYDESMRRLAPDEPIAAEAISVADERAWPELDDWEFGPDAFRDPWLYTDDDDGDGEDLDADGYKLVDDDEQPHLGVRDL